jgi:DNA-binding LytR/AlgR family response regulator
VFPILDRIFLDAQPREDTLTLKLPSGFMRLPFSTLEYLEVVSKKLLFHLSDGSVKEISGALSDFGARLICRDDFIKVHRSYIVNMEHIRLLNARELTTYTNRTVPISRLLYAQVKEAYMRYLFLEKGVE